MTSPGLSESLSAVSVEASPGQSLGQPKKEDYFLCDSTQNSICQIEKPDTESLCEKSISGKNPTNLKQHIKAFHPAVMQVIVRKGRCGKESKT